MAVGFSHSVTAWMRQIDAKPKSQLAMLEGTLAAVRALLEETLAAVRALLEETIAAVRALLEETIATVRAPLAGEGVRVYGRYVRCNGCCPDRSEVLMAPARTAARPVVSAEARGRTPVRPAPPPDNAWT